MTKLNTERLVKLSQKSQIVVRKEVRKALGVKPGSILRTKLEGKRLVVEAFDAEKEMRKVEKIAHMIGRKWPKGLSSVEAIRRERE
jgi:bifunctional DNA-binding transcriptional regulator/antitoxin component of YhaV-PrlF toxin-antitoxin module